MSGFLTVRRTSFYSYVLHYLLLLYSCFLWLRIYFIYFVSVISKAACVLPTSFQGFTCNYKSLKLQLPVRLDMTAVIL